MEEEDFLPAYDTCFGLVRQPYCYRMLSNNDVDST